jgi:hypothetical protein
MPSPESHDGINFRSDNFIQPRLFHIEHLAHSAVSLIRRSLPALGRSRPRNRPPHVEFCNRRPFGAIASLPAELLSSAVAPCQSLLARGLARRAASMLAEHRARHEGFSQKGHQLVIPVMKPLSDVRVARVAFGLPQLCVESLTLTRRQALTTSTPERFLFRLLRCRLRP